jgi:hypothetical protein
MVGIATHLPYQLYRSRRELTAEALSAQSKRVFDQDILRPLRTLRLCGEVGLAIFGNRRLNFFAAIS